MGIFDVQAEANITPIRPIANPAAGANSTAAAGLLQGFGNLFSAGMSSGSGGGESFTERRYNLDVETRSQFTEDMATISAVINSGDRERGLTMARQTIANAQFRGVEMDDSMWTIAETTLGISRDDLIFDPTEVARHQFINSEAGAQQIALAHALYPDASQEELVDIAMERMNQETLLNNRLQDMNVEWATGGREDVFDALDLFQENGIASLTLATQGGQMPSAETVQFARAQLDELWGQLGARYRTAAGDEWRDAELQYTAMQAQLQVLEGMTSAEGIQANLVGQMMRGIYEMTMSGELDLDQAALATSMLTQPELYVNLTDTGEVARVLRGLTINRGWNPADTAAVTDPHLSGGGSPQPVGPGGTATPANQSGPFTLDPQTGIITVSDSVWGEEDSYAWFDNSSNEELYREGAAAADAIGSLAATAITPELAGETSQVLTNMFRRLFSMGTDVNGEDAEFLSAAAVSRIFGGRQIAAIEAIARTDPTVARTLYAQGIAALQAQEAVIGAQISSMDPQVSNVISVRDGRLHVDLRMYAGSGGQFEALQRAAEEVYGGDTLRMIATGGRLLAGTEHEGLQTVLNQHHWVALNQQISEYQGVLDSYRAVQRTRMAFNERLSGMVDFPEPTDVAPEQTDAVPEQAPADPNTGTIQPRPSVDGSVESEIGVSSITEQTAPDGPLPLRPIFGENDGITGPARYVGIRGSENFQDDPEFITGVEQMSERLGADPEHILRVMSFETGHTFSTSAGNPVSSATGLIQFMDSTARNLGTTTEELAQMSRTEQLEYVERYLEPFAGRLNNIGDTYMAVLWPAAVGQSDSYVLWSEGDTAYGPNAGLDLNGDGQVTRGEASRMVIERSGGYEVTEGGSPAVSATGQPVRTYSSDTYQATLGDGWRNLDVNFATGMTGFLQAARAAGFDISIGNHYRSPETQAEILAQNMTRPERGGFSQEAQANWMAAVAAHGGVGALSQTYEGRTWEDWFTNTPNGNSIRQWIGLPGRSNHQHGIAADLEYGSDEARDWAHENAEQFGLHFRMAHEPWHIELMDGAQAASGFSTADAVDNAEGADSPFGGALLTTDNFGSGGGSGGVGGTSTAQPEAPDQTVETADPEAGSEDLSAEESSLAAQQEAQALTAGDVLDERLMRQLRQLGGSEDSPAYGSVEEASAAIRSGELRDGMAFVLNGEVRVYEEPDG